LASEFHRPWPGTGFNITPHPFNATPPFFLGLNATQEALDFTATILRPARPRPSTA